MKRLIIVVLVLLVVASGGAAGLVMLGVVHNPFQKPGADAAKAAAEAEAAAEAASGFKGPTEALQLIKMPDMVVPVIHDGEITRRISVGLRLVTKVATNKPLVTAKLPQFQNDLLGDLVAYFPGYFEHKDIIDVDAIKEKASKHATQVFGDLVTDVLLTNVFESGVQSGAKGSFGTSDE